MKRILLFLRGKYLLLLGGNIPPPFEIEMPSLQDKKLPTPPPRQEEMLPPSPQSECFLPILRVNASSLSSGLMLPPSP